MSPKILASLACVLSVSFLKAQYDDLLRDPDIIWVAEYTADFAMNPEDEEENLLPKGLNYFDLIRLQNAEAENGLYGIRDYSPKYLSLEIEENLRSREILAFKDSTALLALSEEEFLARMGTLDTIPNFEHSWDGPMIMRNDITYDKIRTFRIRQLFWYNLKSEAFDSKLLAYAPIAHLENYEGDIIGKRVLFWFKADSNPPKRFKNKQYSYIFQTKMKDNAPHLDDFKVIKGSFDFRKFFGTEIEKPSHRCLDGYNYTLADMATLQAMCFVNDTIITFHPETYEEQIQIKQRNCIEQIEKIRFVQNWYYDERRHRLYARLVGVAPLAAVRDNEGELRYYEPLFYLMYR